MSPQMPRSRPPCRRQFTAWLALSPVLHGAPAQAQVDADALAKARIAESKTPDPKGEVARKLADAVRALPPWAPFYPSASLGFDSGREGAGIVQVGFTTRDSEDKVARFYVERFKARGKPTDQKEPGVRTIEVSNAKGDQITTVVLQPGEGGRVSALIRHEGGGY